MFDPVTSILGVTHMESWRNRKTLRLFDSTGIAVQNSATVPLEYERALAAGVGVEKKMIST